MKVLGPAAAAAAKTVQAQSERISDCAESTDDGYKVSQAPARLELAPFNNRWFPISFHGSRVVTSGLRTYGSSGNSSSA